MVRKNPNRYEWKMPLAQSDHAFLFFFRYAAPRARGENAMFLSIMMQSFLEFIQFVLEHQELLNAFFYVFVMLSSYLFVLLFIYSTLINQTLAWNQSLGLPVQFSYSWLRGVQLKPIIPEGWSPPGCSKGDRPKSISMEDASGPRS